MQEWADILIMSIFITIFQGMFSWMYNMQHALSLLVAIILIAKLVIMFKQFKYNKEAHIAEMTYKNLLINKELKDRL